MNSRDYKSIMYVVVQAFERALILGEAMTWCIRTGSIGLTHAYMLSWSPPRVLECAERFERFPGVIG